MKRRADHRFTLLEVIVALVILSVGLGLFLGQFAVAARRVSDGMKLWRSTHELTQAAEYLLLAGPEQKLDEDFITKNYRVHYEYLEPTLPDDRANLVGSMELTTLSLWLEDPSGERIDELAFDCWKEANVIPAE